MRSLDDIISVLQRYHQRATYGAVAALVGRPARSLMTGRSMEPLNSWVVRHDSGLPTGYEPAMIHPALHERREVLSDASALASWLDDPH